MGLSGIVVCAKLDDLAELALLLSELPGVNVHQRDAATGRLVLTLEAASADEELDRLRRIQGVPGVVSADLVYHRVADDVEPPASSNSSHTSGFQRGET